MISREQIEEIQSESRARGVSIKKLLEEKGIPSHQYFWWKRKYGRQEVAEGFLPVAGAMPPAVVAEWGGQSASRGKPKTDHAAENRMNIELSTVPFHPECTAATAFFTGSCIRIGTQSAVRTPIDTPKRLVTNAS